MRNTPFTVSGIKRDMRRKSIRPHSRCTALFRSIANRSKGWSSCSCYSARAEKMAVQRDKVIASAAKLVAKGKMEPSIKENERLLEDYPNDVNTLNRTADLWVLIY